MYVLELDEFKGKMSNCLGFFIFKKKDVAIIKLIFFFISMISFTRNAKF